MRKWLLPVGGIILLSLVLVIWTAWQKPHPAAPQKVAPASGESDTVLPLPAVWTGDFDGMKERRLIRILTPYSSIFYFIDRGQEFGSVHDLGRQLEAWLNRKYHDRSRPLRIMFIPTARDRLLPDLLEGLGDIAAGNLTITPNRQALVDFTAAARKDVNEIVVTGPAAPALETLQDLAQVTIYVRESSSYFEHLRTLDENGKLGLKILAADENLEDEKLLDMVNAGILPLAIVDDHKARFWAQVYPHLTLRDDLVINRGGQTAWAVRKNSPLLLAELNEFGRKVGLRQGLINMLGNRYLGSAKRLQNATSDSEMAYFDKLIDLFRKYGERYDFDPLMLMAQGYQESRLRQSAKSRAGAVGIMQVLPETAKSEPVGIDDIDTSIENNIHAGVKYLRFLIDTYLNEEGIDDTNRLLLGFAAYNAGPGNLQRMRRLTEQAGLDPDRWFQHVEVGAAQVVGRETVQYVSNIYKYYVAYRLSVDKHFKKEEAKKEYGN
jgi:membrane-bound lytic murein transglycosylase MltF